MTALSPRPVRPVSRAGWWVFWLGLLAAALGLFLPFITQTIATAIRASGLEPTLRIPLGFNMVLLALVVAAVTLIKGVRAVGRGERSWLTIIGMVLALLAGGFWLLFALGELLFPH